MGKKEYVMADAHCHLQDPRLRPGLPGVLSRAQEAGVSRMHCCGTREADWDAVLALSRCARGVGVSFGLHPWYVGGRTEKWLIRLAELLRETPSGVGEIGLDHAVPKPDPEAQAEVFTLQLRLARELGRPVSIHCRRAWGALAGILSAEGGLPHGGMIHSYSGSAEMVPLFEKMGCHISFSGALTRAGGKRVRAACRAVSPGRLLIETDSPFLPPEGMRTPDNEPSNLGLVCASASALRGVPESVLAAISLENYRVLFEGTVT